MKKLLIMMVIIIGIILVSCNDPEENTVKDSDTSAVITETVPETERYTIPDVNFNGEEIRFIVRDGGIYWTDKDFFAEIESGEPFNDAVYTRNRIVEEKLNVKIKQTLTSTMYNDVRTQLLADSVSFDVIAMVLQHLAIFAQEGLLVDLYDMPYIQLENPWWDQIFNNDMTINNKLFFSLGDINTIDNDATWVVLFNKDLSANYSLKNHYEAVNNYEWTIDLLYDNCKKATQDLNGDGLLTPEDQWGAVGQLESAYALLAAAGIKSVTKTPDDFPELNINSEFAADVMVKIYEFLTDDTAQIKADDPKYTGKYADIWTAINVNSFLENRALYYLSPMCTVPFFRGMEQNFGLLPLPMYNESQQSYHSPVQYNNATAISFPISGTDYEKAGLVVEVMAAESEHTIKMAYYDTNLKTKLTRDNESADMLDLMFVNRLYDIGIAFNWSNIQGFYQDIVKSTSFNFVSSYQSKESGIKSAMQKTVDQFSELN